MSTVGAYNHLAYTEHAAHSPPWAIARNFSTAPFGTVGGFLSVARRSTETADASGLMVCVDWSP